MTRGGACALALVALLASKSALANGRFPAAGQIVFDPNDSRHLAVRATFGLLTSRDRGETFDYVCESALRLGVEEDPMLAFTASGPLVVATFGGVLTSTDDCSYTFVPELEGQIVLDLARSAGAPDTLVAYRLRGLGGGLYRSSLIRSDDASATWTIFPDLPEELLPITVDVAAGDATRVYLSARRGQADDYDSVLLVSSDGGESFEARPIPETSGQHLAYIAAVHPSDPERLWLRIDDPDGTRLVETRDAGATFEHLFTANGLLTGFAVSPDGTEVAMGGLEDGLWVRTDDGGAFEPRSDVGPTCLAWNTDGLWACADSQRTGFSLGLSLDAGRTFEPLLLYADLCGTSSCGAETDVGALCPNDWAGVAPLLGAECDGGVDAGTSDGGEASRPKANGGCAVSCASTTRQPGLWVFAAVWLMGMGSRRATSTRRSTTNVGSATAARSRRVPDA